MLNQNKALSLGWWHGYCSLMKHHHVQLSHYHIKQGTHKGCRGRAAQNKACRFQWLLAKAWETLGFCNPSAQAESFQALPAPQRCAATVRILIPPRVSAGITNSCLAWAHPLGGESRLEDAPHHSCFSLTDSSSVPWIKLGAENTSAPSWCVLLAALPAAAVELHGSSTWWIGRAECQTTRVCCWAEGWAEVWSLHPQCLLF